MKQKILILTLVAFLLSISTVVLGAEPVAQNQPGEVLTIEKALELAFKNSNKLKIAKKQVEMATASLIDATGKLWPSIEYSYTRLNTEKPNPMANGSKDIYSAELSANLMLYTGGRTTAGIITAKLDLDSKIAEEQKTKQELTADVKSKYYQLWVTEQKLKVAKSSYENRGKHYQRVKQFFDVGNSSKYELLQAQVLWEKMKPLVIHLENELASNKLDFAILIGLSKESNFTVNYDPANLQLNEITTDLTALLDEAYRNNPEMLIVKNEKEMAKQGVRVAYSGYKPTVVLKHAYEGSDIEEETPFAIDRSWSLTLNLSGTLFDGFSTPAKVAKAKDTVDITTIKETLTKDTIRSLVQSAQQHLKESVETTRVNQSNVALCQEKLRMTQAKFDAGMATTIDVSDSQIDLDNAFNDYYDSISLYLTAQAKLDQVLGRNTYKE